MSISLNTPGALVLQASATGTNSNTMTINVPTSLTSNRTISIPDPGNNSSLQLGIKQVLPVGAATTLTVAQSGYIIAFNNATAYTITLPTAATSAGVYYNFVQTTPAAANTVQIDSGADNKLWGNWVQASGVGGGSNVAGNRYFNFLASATVKGDSAYAFCDGTQWYIFGLASFTDAMSFT